MRRMGLKNQIMTVALAVAVLLGSGAAASATVMNGDSNAYNAGVGLTILHHGILDITIPTNSGTAPAPYNKIISLVGADAVVDTDPMKLSVLESLTLGLKADLLKTHAKSNVDGTKGWRFAEADQKITNLGTKLTDTLLGGLIPKITLLNIITADLIYSDATVSGEYGALNDVGHTTITNLRVLGQLIDSSLYLGLDGYVKKNTLIDLSLLGLANVTLKLNEQIESGDGSTNRALTVNAIDLDLNGYSLLGQVVTADVIIGHAEAELKNVTPNPPNPVPEPSTFMLIGGGLAGLAFWRRRQRK